RGDADARSTAVPASGTRSRGAPLRNVHTDPTGATSPRLRASACNCRYQSGAGRDFLIGARQRIARAGIAEPPELFEPHQRLAHREHLVARLAGLRLRLDEGEHRAEVV